jgi:hypothetical protein
VTETEVKYLAGLIDADGSIGFEFNRNRVYLALSLCSASSIDKHGYVKNLPNTTGAGTACEKETRNPKWAPITVWKVMAKNDIERLLPRLIKHLVIKGKHFQRMFDQYKKVHGNVVSDIEIDQLKLFAKLSREDAGPVKPKKHPTWAWIAGYLDGDGCYMYQKSPSMKTPIMLVQATAHKNDLVGLELLYKAFGGRLQNRGVSCEHIYDWKHALGSSNQQFALRFLTKVLQHSRLKKHKIEQLLAVCHSRTRTD